MLYDPKWEAQTKPDTFDLEGLISWLETQPPTMSYNYDCYDGRCLLGLYSIAVTGTNRTKEIYDENAMKFNLGVNERGFICASRPRTLGGGLERALIVRQGRAAGNKRPYSNAGMR